MSLTAKNITLTIQELLPLSNQPMTSSWTQSITSIKVLDQKTVICVTGTLQTILELKDSGPYTSGSMRYCGVTNVASVTGQDVRLSLSGSKLGYVTYLIEPQQKLLFYNNKILTDASSSSGYPITGEAPLDYLTWSKMQVVAIGTTGLPLQFVYAAIETPFG